MLNIGFFKGQPTHYILKFTAGRLAREGQGLTFFYFKHNTQIATIPTTSTDANFVFNEATKTFQSVTIQGQFTYRVRDPKRAADLLNYTINLRQQSYLSDDPDRLPQRISNIIQMETRVEIQKRTLELVLGEYETMASAVLERIQSAKLLDSLGVELMNVYFVSAKPTPEVGKALEAEYRESLLRKADEAIFARRAAAVAEERKIKENELNTEITLAEQRRKLIDLEGNNTLQEAQNRGQAIEKEAEYKARAKQMELAVYQALDPRSIVALALNEMGLNAERVGNLTITTEVLSSLLNTRPES